MRGWALGVACAWIACAGPSAAANCSVNQIAQLPVTMQGLRPTVPARIESHDVRLLVDSGAFWSLISPGTAAELKLNLRPTGFGFAIRGVGGETGAQIATIQTFTIDSIPLHNILFLVGGSETGAAGILGRNVLDLADTEYDLANGVVRLFKPSGCGDRPLAYWAGTKSFSRLTILSVENRLSPLLVEVKVNGVTMKALLDTGSAASTIAIGAAKRAGMVVAGGDTTGGTFSRGIGRRLVHDSSRR